MTVVNHHSLELTFNAVDEPLPGPAWLALFHRTWPSYKDWFLLQGARASPTYLEASQALKKHLPELVPIYENLCDLAGGSDLAARMLALYSPAPYLAGCSQAIFHAPDPILIRNYEYAPERCEGEFLRSRWLGRTVLAMSDCLWGALDGINDAGLAASLAFGGREIVGDGFGIPILLRWILETADSTHQAAHRLARVRSHMAYTVTLLDRHHNLATCYLAPDHDTIVTKDPAATNHQRHVHWPAYARFTRSVERVHHLHQLQSLQHHKPEHALEQFLNPPLFSNHYERGWGTLYTALYHPDSQSARIAWPNHQWILATHRFHNTSHTARYHGPQLNLHRPDNPA